MQFLTLSIIYKWNFIVNRGGVALEITVVVNW